MVKKYLLLISFLLFSAFLSANNLSPNARIYLLTCQPGTEIYATFGHSAIYVKDDVQQIDYVFNYGVFSFNAEHFLYKFLKGETYYILGVEYYDYFLASYERRQMGVSAQELNLTPLEKNHLYKALTDNAAPENREYLYNFFLDNCATRIGDIVENNASGTIIYPQSDIKQSYRELVEMFTGQNTWLKFGIDILIGAPADTIISNHDKMFLPYFLRDDYAGAVIERNEVKEPLVASTQQLIPDFSHEEPNRLLSPVAVMWVLFLLAFLLSAYDLKKKKQSIWFDFTLFLIIGLIGVLVAFISFISIHPTVFPNYNILWLHPFHFLFAVMLLIKDIRNKLNIYHYINLGLIALAVLSSLLFQSFHPAFYPLMLVIALRSGTSIYLTQHAVRNK